MYARKDEIRHSSVRGGVCVCMCFELGVGGDGLEALSKRQEPLLSPGNKAVPVIIWQQG